MTFFLSHALYNKTTTAAGGLPSPGEHNKVKVPAAAGGYLSQPPSTNNKYSTSHFNKASKLHKEKLAWQAKSGKKLKNLIGRCNPEIDDVTDGKDAVVELRAVCKPISADGECPIEKTFYPTTQTPPPPHVYPAPDTQSPAASCSSQGQGHRAASVGWSQTADRLEGIEVIKLFIASGESLGVEFAGGFEFGCPVSVARLDKYGVAYRDGSLDVGDVILCVNGIDVTLARQHDVIGLTEMTSSSRGQPLVLTIQHTFGTTATTSTAGVTSTFTSPELHLSPSDHVTCRRIEILLTLAPAAGRQDDVGSWNTESGTGTGGGSFGFGFVLRGGAHSDPAKCRPMTVTRVIPGSPADREGTLRPGDRIISIDGVDVTRCRLLHAASLMTSRSTSPSPANRSVVLVVEYDVIVLGRVLAATGPVVVDIDKPSGTTLDVTLADDVDVDVDPTTQGLKHSRVVVVDSVYEAGTAERSGAVHVGDRILSVDGVSTASKSAAEVTSLMQSNLTECIQLEILPVSAVKHRSRPTDAVKHSSKANHPQSSPTSSPAAAAAVSRQQAIVNGSQVTLAGSQIYSCVGDGSRTTLNRHQLNMTTELDMKSGHSPGPVSTRSLDEMSRSSTPGGTLTFSVQLPTEAGPLGIVVSEVIDRSEVATSAAAVVDARFYVSNVIDGGLADQTATVRLGDGVLSINGIPLKDKCLSDVQLLLEQTADWAVTSLRICRPSMTYSGGTGGNKGRPGVSQQVIRQSSFDSAVASWDCAIAAAAALNNDNNSPACLRITENNNNNNNIDAEDMDELVPVEDIIKPVTVTSRPGDRTISPKTRHCVDDSTEGKAGQLLNSLQQIIESTGDRKTVEQIPCVSEPNGLNEDCMDPVEDIIRPTRITHPGDRTIDPSSRQYTGERTDKASVEFLDPVEDIIKPVTVASHTGDRTISPSTRLRVDEGDFLVDRSRRVASNRKYRKNDDNDDKDEVDGVDNTSTSFRRFDAVDGYELGHVITPPGDRHGSINSQLSGHDHDKSWSTRSPGVARKDERGPAEEEDEDEKDQLSQVEELLDSIFTPTPVELVKITLHKPRTNAVGILRRSTRGGSEDGTGTGNSSRRRCHQCRSVGDVRTSDVDSGDDDVDVADDDFGFSLSDGLYEKGVYVSAIRPGGPASVRGGLQIYDRILQVNKTKTKDLDCHQVAPLIARSSSNQVQLIVCRNALRSAHLQEQQQQQRQAPPVGHSATFPRQPLPRQPLPPRHPSLSRQPVSPSDDPASVWRRRPRVTFVDDNCCRSTVL